MVGTLGMKEDDFKTIHQIKSVMQATQCVPAPTVKGWLRNPSLEVLSVVVEFISEHSRQIEPPLTMDEICNAVRGYYQRCLQQDFQSEFIPNLHIAGYEFVSWFRGLWKDIAVPRKYLLDLKAMLAELYEAASPQTKDELVNAVLEHLFEMPEIAEFFADWKSDPMLGKAYACAMEWAKDRPRYFIP